MELLFLAADTLGTTLYEVDNDLVRGAKTQKVKMGFWELSLDTIICSDEMNTQEVGVVVRLRKDAWMYLVVHADGTMEAHLFDGGMLQLKSKDVSKVGMNSIKATLKKIKPLERQVLYYTPVTDTWGTKDALYMEQVS